MAGKNSWPARTAEVVQSGGLNKLLPYYKGGVFSPKKVANTAEHPVVVPVVVVAVAVHVPLVVPLVERQELCDWPSSPLPLELLLTNNS